LYQPSNFIEKRITGSFFIISNYTALCITPEEQVC
jgi:hypothetical protein